MATNFAQLNRGWNADPNAPHPNVEVNGDVVDLCFRSNSFQFPEYAHGQLIRILFRGVWRFGFSDLNDEGWYRGQCRFTFIAPSWGQFYEVSGDLILVQCEVDWRYLSDRPQPDSRHFLFYFRDNTFECDATSWKRQDQ